MSENTPFDSTPVPEYAELISLDGGSVLVIGAGQGIGRQCAHAFAQSGAHVICVDTLRERADRVADEIGGTAAVLDATDEASVSAFLDGVRQRTGPVDVIIDVVGMARFTPLDEATDEDWRWQFGIVLDHARHLLKHGPRVMPEDGGAITFVSSIAALTGAQGNGPYAAAKAALVSLTRTAAVELAPRGIRVNSVAPDVVLTPRMEQILEPERRRRFIDNSPLGRLCTVSDVAASMLFLSTPLASYITGQTLVLDAGVSARLPYPDFV